MEIKIYSTPTCPYCRMAKEYIIKKGLSYIDFDVSKNKEALEEMIKISGQMGVPVIVINNEVIIGFDRERIDNLLEK